MKRFEEKRDFDDDFKSMNNKITMIEEEQQKILHQINRKMDEEANVQVKASVNWRFYIALSAAAFLIIILAQPLFTNLTKDGTSNLINEESPEEQEAINTVDDIQNIEKVLKKVFTGPDSELTELYSGNWESEFEKILIYYQENFKNYFTEDYYDTVVKLDIVSVFHLDSFNNNYRMEAEEINIQQNKTSDNAFDFTVNVLLHKEEEGSKTVKMIGRIDINKNGKIVRIMYHNGEEFLETISSGNSVSSKGQDTGIHSEFLLTEEEKEFTLK